MTTTTITTRLPADVKALMRALHLAHARAIAADVLVTFAQRWDSTEVIKALPAEESGGRSGAMLASRRSLQSHPSGFAELMPKTPPTATVDRLLQRCDDLEMNSPSYRLKERLNLVTGGEPMP